MKYSKLTTLSLLVTVFLTTIAGAANFDQIIDIESPAFSKQCPGKDYWIAAEYTGIDYWYTFAVENDECSASWQPQMAVAGRYKVSAVFWARTPESGWRSDNVKYIVRENGESYEIRVDQTGGDWERKRVYLGEFYSQTGSDLAVEVWDNDGSPYDGSRLIVADTLEFIYQEPVSPSTGFSAGDTVRVNAEGIGLNSRVGPGMHHQVIRGVPDTTVGEVQSADDNGLFTDGYYWWKVAWEDSYGTTGWSVEEGMELISTPRPSPPSPPATPIPTPSVVTTPVPPATPAPTPSVVTTPVPPATPAPTPSVTATPALTPTPIPPTPGPTVKIPSTATPPEPVPTATIFVTPPPTIPPTPRPQETLTLGLITVYADSIHGGTGWPKVASGNVNLNGVIFAAGEIEINREGGVDGIYGLSGSTRLYLKEIPLPWDQNPGEVTLYAGDFSYEVDANGLILDYLNQGLEYLQVAGLEAEIKTISFLSDGVELSADLYFPGKEAAVEVGRLRISRSEGMSLTGYILIGGIEIEIDELEITSDKLVLNYGRVIFPEYFSPAGLRFEPKKSAIAPLDHTSPGLDFLALPEEDPGQSPTVIANSDSSAEASAKAEASPARRSFNKGGKQSCPRPESVIARSAATKQSHKVSTRNSISGVVEDRGVNYPGSFSAFFYRLSNEEPSESDQLIDISVVGPDGRYAFSDLPSGDYAVKMGGRITVEIIGLEISAAGFHLVSGEVTDIPDLEYADMILTVESLGFSTEPLGAELNEVALLLPEILGGGIVQLDLLRVTGQGVDVVGSIEDFSFTIPKSGFGLTIDEFYFDTINDRFGGLGSLHAPTLPDIAVGVGFSGREVSWVRAEVQGLNYPIYSVVFLQTVSLEINELESAPPPPIIIAVAGLSAGPTWSIPGTSDSVVLLAADPISLTVDTGDFAEITGTMTLFKPSSGTMTGRISFLKWGWNYDFSGFDLAGVQARLSRSRGFTASAYLDVIDILKGTSTLSVDRSTKISGNTVGTLQVPSRVPLLGGRRLGGFNSILNNRYLAGEGWASRLLSVAVRFDYDGKIRFGRNLASLGVTRLSSRMLAKLKRQGAVLPIADRIEVPAGIKRAVFRFAWQESVTEVTLVAPDGTEISPADGPLTSEYFNYLLDEVNREAWYVVKDPQPGLWGYRLSNAEIGELEVELIELEEPPAIEMASLPGPARGLGPLTSGRTIRLSWNPASLVGDEKISLYYDEEQEGYTGQLIAEDLSASQGWYDWVIGETVPSGCYFIYAVLDNGRTAPSASYMPGMVTVTNPLAPAPPRNLALSVSGVAVTANWEENLEADLIGYLLEWTDDLSAVSYDQRLAVGGETSHTLELLNGRGYKIRVKAINEAGYESLPSDTRTVQLSFDPENRAPRIISQPVNRVRAETEYQYRVAAEDDDGDTICYSLTAGPEGMSVDSATGWIQWRPEANDVGLIEVEVQASDAAAADSQRFFVEVYNNYMANLSPVISSRPETMAQVSREYIYQVEAVDPDDDPLAYSLAAAPEGMTITGDGLAVWTPTGSDQPGENLIEVRVSDGKGGMTRQVFTVNLLERPLEPTPTPVPPLTPTPSPEPTPTPTPTPEDEPSPTPIPSSTPSYRMIVSGDYNGDGTSDIAVFQPDSGLWAVRSITRAYFGGSSDLPVPGDYTGDGTTEIAVFRPESGLWAVRGGERVYFGRADDIPVPADYTGDSSAALAVFRPSSGLWAIRGIPRVYFGRNGDLPVPGYYAGDGVVDVAIFRPSSGLWAVQNLTRLYFGISDDHPVPGDYDGAGSWDFGIFRATTGLWAVRDGSRVYFGQAGDLPIPGVYRGDGTDRMGIFRESSGLWAIKDLTRAYYGSSGDIPVTR